jgi:hypothetical protein
MNPRKKSRNTGSRPNVIATNTTSSMTADTEWLYLPGRTHTVRSEPCGAVREHNFMWPVLHDHPTHERCGVAVRGRGHGGRTLDDRKLDIVSEGRTRTARLKETLRRTRSYADVADERRRSGSADGQGPANTCVAPHGKTCTDDSATGHVKAMPVP